MKCCRFGAGFVYTIQPCTRLQCHFIQSHISRVYACLAVTATCIFGRMTGIFYVLLHVYVYVCVCMLCVCAYVCVRACMRACVRACVRVHVCVCVNLHLYFSLSLKGCMYTEEGNQTGLVYIHKSKTCKAESQIKATLPEAIVCKLQQAILLLACPFY